MYLLIVEAIVSLAYAYAAVVNANNGGDYLNKLTEIQDQLDKISQQLDDIKDQLNDIETAIALLPAKIRGVVDDALARTAMGVAKSICQRLNDYMRPEYLEQSLSAMQQDLNDLQDQIGAIKGAKGMAGLLMTAPLMSTWLAGRVTYEKAALLYIKGHKLDSPWNQTFMIDSHSEFQEAFARMDDAETYFEDWFRPHAPYIDDLQKIIANGTNFYFQRTSRFLFPVYRIHDQFNPRLQVWSVLDWRDVNLQNAGTDYQAADAYNLFKSDEAEESAFAQVYDQIQKKRVDLFNSFMEPANFWN